MLLSLDYRTVLVVMLITEIIKNVIPSFVLPDSLIWVTEVRFFTPQQYESMCYYVLWLYQMIS